MDSLSIILHTVREELGRVSAALQLADGPEPQDLTSLALSRAELKIRRCLGAQRHYINRAPKVDTLHTLGMVCVKAGQVC